MTDEPYDDLAEPLANDESPFPPFPPGLTWYCPRGCQAFEPSLTCRDPPECGSCGTPMSTDPTALYDVHEAIERLGVAEIERARSALCAQAVRRT